MVLPPFSDFRLTFSVLCLVRANKEPTGVEARGYLCGSFTRTGCGCVVRIRSPSGVCVIYLGIDTDTDTCGTDTRLADTPLEPGRKAIPCKKT